MKTQFYFNLLTSEVFIVFRHIHTELLQAYSSLTAKGYLKV